MSDIAYIMETQDPRELWLIDGENKFRVSRDMYWLLASNGADLPPTHHIAELLAENIKLREMMQSVLVLRHDPVYKWLDATFVEVFGKSFTEQARELGVEVD